MYRDVYYRDPKTGEVTMHSMYESNALESVKKWPKEYSFKRPKDVDDDKIKDLRPPQPNPQDFKDEEKAPGPPVADRPGTASE